MKFYYRFYCSILYRCLCLMILLALVNVQANEEKITYSYFFSDPKIVTTQGFDQFEMEDTYQSIASGKPVLPFRMVRLLLPYNSRVKSVVVKRMNLKKLGNNFNIKIANSMLPLSFPRNFNKLLSKSQKFETTSDYPEASSYHSLQKYHGYTLLLSKIHPIFINATNEVHFASTIELEIVYTFDKANGGNEKGLKHLVDHADDVWAMIDNKDAIDNYYHFSEKSGEKSNTYDYLIISTANLIRSSNAYNLNAFKEYLEQKRGLKVKIVDVATAISQERGVDNAQKLRNFIKKEYAASNIRFVLLAGDADERAPMIPYRKLYAKIRGYNGRWMDISEQIPADFYYGCLDGDFDGNGNGIWGEANDGANGGDVDFLCEVTVGRMPVDNATELANVIKKGLDVYNYNAGTRDPNAFLLGEELFKELNLWGGDYMDDLIGEVNDHGFISKGFDTSWTIKKMYDSNARSKWTGVEASTEVNAKDYLVINHLGHSSKTYNMRINGGWSYREFKNARPFFYYTQGCFPGNFPTDDSIIEHFFTGEKGAFATISNSSYGLGPEDPEPTSTKTPGTSQILNRFFIHRLLMENEMKFALAHQKSKEDILIYIDHQEARWVIWAANFFGDPALSVKAKR
ncbi:MAG: hypothetical protein HQK50_06640 [Oligoflexia bacterium]|nr:hypothetical protein [Oligoflexia bacterium]